jgi:methyl-accepting chemotaxis protein
MAIKKSPDLRKVGEGGAGKAPSDRTQPKTAGPKSRWWKTQKSQDHGFERLSPQWANSATGEIERFKHVPVVGRLPWRWQYIVAAIGLLLGVVVMAMLVARIANGSQGENTRRVSELAVRQSISDVERALWLAKTNPDVAAPALKDALNSGNSAVASWVSQAGANVQIVSDEWKKTAQMVNQLLPVLPQAALMKKSSAQARQILAPGIQRANATLGVAQDAEASSARNFLTSTALWLNALDRVEEGGRWSSDISSQQASMNAAVNAFSSSSMASSSGAGANAWRQAGTAWAQASPSMQAVVANAPAWNKMLALEATLRQQVAKTMQAAETASEPLSRDRWLLPITMLAVAWVVVCLLMLMGIGWKQQRYQALAALAAHEQTEGEILNLMEDLRQIADGDMTHRARVSETPVGTMADMLNETVVSLAGLVKGVKSHVERGAAASQNAAEATSALVDSARDDQDAILNNGKELAKVVEGILEVASISSETKRLSDSAMTSAVNGRGAVSEAHRYIQEIRTQTEEARNRVERLAQSSREISGIATLMNEIADGIGVLAMQAALQAARAGEKGQGFRVVADGVSDLAKKSGVASRRVGALIETALGDIDGAAASMRAATKGTDESSRLMDISLEASQGIEEALIDVTGRVSTLQTVLDEQRTATQALDNNAKEGLSRVQESQNRAQAAAEGVMQLFDSSREMASSANRFKV